jgi:GNAT superfamily N-acetyltransferase
MFCTPQMAARIDRAEGRMCAAMCKAMLSEALALPVAGGIAVYGGDDSPTNKLIGAGFDGEAVDTVCLANIEEQFATRNARLQAEVSTLASPELHALLTSRGYRPSGFENVLGHALTDQLEPVAGVEVSPMLPTEDRAFADILVEAFASPDTGGVGGDEIPPSDVIRRWVLLTARMPGFYGMIARVNGQFAGAAALRFDDRIAQFNGAGTLPRFRHRGVQTALLRARLAEAKGNGCEIGVVVTQPASKSQQNVQREGFSLLYSRQLLVKDAPAT